MNDNFGFLLLYVAAIGGILLFFWAIHYFMDRAKMLSRRRREATANQDLGSGAFGYVIAAPVAGRGRETELILQGAPFTDPWQAERALRAIADDDLRAAATVRVVAIHVLPDDEAAVIDQHLRARARDVIDIRKVPVPANGHLRVSRSAGCRNNRLN